MTTTIDRLWLTSEQQTIWRTYLAGVSRINERLDAELRPFGLDLGEYEILVNLSEADQLEMRMSELADRVRQSRSRLTHTVARMEAKGLILRKSCPHDRRGVIARGYRDAAAAGGARVVGGSAKRCAPNSRASSWLRTHGVAPSLSSTSSVRRPSSYW